MRKHIKPGERVKFTIINPNWKLPLTAEGEVEVIQDGKFNGMVKFKSGSVILDEILIRSEQIL